MITSLALGTFQLHQDVGGVSSVTHIEGLTGIPGVRGETYDRPENDGVVEPYAQFLTERNIVIEGEIWASDGLVETAWTTWNQLAQVLETSMNTGATLTWQHAGGSITYKATVKLSGPVTPILDGFQPLIHYQLHLRAADPRTYANTTLNASASVPSASGGMPLPVIFPIPFGTGASGGTMTIANGGNSKVYPRFTVAGPINGVVILNTTQNVGLYFETLNLGATQTLTVDCNPASRVATVDGSSVFGSLRFADSKFFYINPGATETIQFYGISGGYGAGTSMSATWSNAYIS